MYRQIPSARFAAALSVALLLVALGTGRCLAQGSYMSSAGPVNRSMGGASTAAPIDALGALYWNPATISGLECSELAFGMDLLYSNHSVSSSVGPFSGSTDAENGFFPIPNVGWVHHIPDSNLTFGLGLNSVAGFKTNLPSSLTNPVLMPQPLGLGRVSSEATFFQIDPMLSYRVTDQLSLGVGPTITMAQVGFEPFVFDAPNANGYPPARSTRYHWGGGLQAGAYYISPSAWHFGASVKTPQWMEPLHFNGQDAIGGPRDLRWKLDLPLIVSLGTAYAGFEDWIFAADVRYFNYADADGFGDPATFDSRGAVMGLGWNNVMAVGLGAQRRISDRWLVRGGYTFNESPIGNTNSFFNVAAPLIYKHTLNVGASLQLSPVTSVNFAYSYFLPAEVTGPIVLPGIGPVPGSSVTNQLDAHFLSFGVSTRY
jgi:long-chain fatty acid transport protein